MMITIVTVTITNDDDVDNTNIEAGTVIMLFMHVSS